MDISAGYLDTKSWKNSAEITEISMICILRNHKLIKNIWDKVLAFSIHPVPQGLEDYKLYSLERTERVLGVFRY